MENISESMEIKNPVLTQKSLPFEEKLNIPKSESLDKGAILVIFLLFMFSSKLWQITWDIGTSLLYLIIAIYFLNYVYPPLGTKIKEIIMDFINLDSNNSFLKDFLSETSKQIIDEIKTPKNEPINKNTVEEYHPMYYNNNLNKNLSNVGFTNQRNMSLG